MEKNYKIPVETPGMSKMIQMYLFSKGYKWAGGECATPQNLSRYGIVIDIKRKAILYYSDRESFNRGGEIEINPWELTDLLEEKCSVKLNENYTAVLDDGVVKVGCQTFEESKILELADIIKEKRKNDS